MRIGRGETTFLDGGVTFGGAGFEDFVDAADLDGDGIADLLLSTAGAPPVLFRAVPPP